MQLPADGFIVACFPHKIKGGSAAAGLEKWPCSIRSLPNWLSLRSNRRMKRDQEKRVVVLMLATLLPIEGPLRVMGGCIELRTAWPHHPNNRTRWCAGSAWVKGVPSDCVLSMG